MPTKYDIKRFTNSRDSDFVEALNIYCKETPGSVYTNSNDIVYWIDNYKKFFPDELFVLGFYVNNRISGFAQFVYMHEEKLIFIDYMSIIKERRGNNSFYEFVSQIREFIEHNNIHFNYVLVEYPYMNHDSEEPSHESRRLIRLLKMQNFGIIGAPYFQPAHGLGNKESYMKAFLLIYSKNDIKTIKRETYLEIVSILLYKHYYRWYQNIEKDIDLYKKHLDTIYKQILAEVNKQNIIKINGYKREEPTSIQTPKKEIPYMLFTAIITFLTITMALINHYLQLPMTGVVIFWLLALVSFFSLVAVFGESKSAEKVIKTIMQPLIKVFGKLK